MCNISVVVLLFFFNDTATTEIYTLSLHDALPICQRAQAAAAREELESQHAKATQRASLRRTLSNQLRSEEHTSELQSHQYLVCRLLLEKKNKPQSHTASDAPLHSPLPASGTTNTV